MFHIKPIQYWTYLSNLWDYLYKLHHDIYAKLEARVLEGEHSERFRIKKCILLYNCYLSIIYSIINQVINPYTSAYISICNIASAVCQMFFISRNNYCLIGSYVYIHAILMLILQYFIEREPLTLMGLVLVNQHMFFLFPESKFLNRIYIPIVVVLFRLMQNELVESLSLWDERFEISIKSLCCSWPIIFLLHHYGAKNLTTSYRLALIKNMEIQKELKDTLTLLEKANKELQGAVQARELFIASVSHEFRNPLNCLIGNIELLRLDIKNEKWLKALDTCKTCGEVLLGQINNVLDVAKINAEKLELHNLPTNFHKLVEKVWKISTISLKQKKLNGMLRISSNFPKYIKMDSHRVTQILLNLIGNASKFTKEGFVNVTITWHQTESFEELKVPGQSYVNLLSKKRKESTSSDSKSSSLDNENDPSFEYDDLSEKCVAIDGILKREICPKLISQVLTPDLVQSTADDLTFEEKHSLKPKHSLSEKGLVKIEVIDSGCGISNDSLGTLFEPFKQADSSITRQYGGTGLGLYITKQIIQRMGGEIFVYSHEHVGTNFCVIVPAESASEEETKEEGQNETFEKHIVPSQEVRALVVDDIPANQLVLCSYLKKLNVHSETANNGLEAVEMIKSKALDYYSLVTMDLQMPVMDGFTASREIRKYEKLQKAKKDLPIIVITGNCTDTEKNICLDKNGDIRAENFFRKPFTFDECKSIVQSLMLDKQTIRKRILKALIVDDDPFNTSICQQFFQEYGFSCVVCSNGKEAVMAAKKENFDVILMDCEMPEMDGYTASRIIKGSNRSAYIIGVTGHRKEECLSKCLENGMEDVEMKPVNFRKLIKVVLKTIEERNNGSIFH